jgi:glycolate oxidase FAD binding subunit
VSFKVLPAPEAQATLVLRGLSDAQAVAAMSAALGSPFEVTGAAHWPGQGTYLRIEGFAASVAYRRDRLIRHLARFGGLEDADPAIWTIVRDVAPFHGAAGDVWRLSLRPSTAASVVARAGAEAALYDWGGGLVWLRVAAGTDLRARLGAIEGHATLVRAESPALPAFAPEADGIAALAAGLRARFDPKAILNHGRMG